MIRLILHIGVKWGAFQGLTELDALHVTGSVTTTTYCLQLKIILMYIYLKMYFIVNKQGFQLVAVCFECIALYCYTGAVNSSVSQACFSFSWNCPPPQLWTRLQKLNSTSQFIHITKLNMFCA